MSERIALSVLDIEKKYTYDVDEASYGSDNIVQWGKNNDANILFRNCYRGSATLKSIIDGSVNFVVGDSIEVNAKAWEEKVNRRGMSMRQFVAALALSYLTYGGFAIQVIFNKIGVPVEMFPLDFGRCRTNEAGTKVWYSKKNWSKWSTKAEVFDTFDPEKFDMEHPTQIYYFKGDFTTSVYPLPPFYGAIADVLTEMECSKYSLNSVANGFSARYVFNIPEANNLTDEQKKGWEDAIKSKFCGSEPEANFLLYWMDGGQGIEIAKIEGDETPERFIAVKDNARTNIFIAMRATPNIFGLPTAGNGFNSQEFSAAEKLYEKTVIDPIRDIIKEAIDKITGIDDSITITPFSISFDDNGE